MPDVATPSRDQRTQHASGNDDAAYAGLAAVGVGVGAWLLLRKKPSTNLAVTPTSACPATIKPRSLYRDTSSGAVYIITDDCHKRQVTPAGMGACNYAASAVQDVSSALLATVASGPDVTGPPCPPGPINPSLPAAPAGPPQLSAPGVGGAATRSGRGYWLVGSDGDVIGFGDARGLGGEQGVRLNAPVVGMAAARNGLGYWLVAADGGVFAFGAQYNGSIPQTPAIRLSAPISGIDGTPSGGGYWLCGRDGGVFSFGNAPFFGSDPGLGLKLNAPVIGMAARPQGDGYWLAGADGGVFSFGGAPFMGSAQPYHLVAPAVDIEPHPSGLGYWLCAADGGVFAFGASVYHGGCVNNACHTANASPQAPSLNAPIVGMSSTPTGNGYWLFARDGGVFSFGDAQFYGSTGANPPAGVA